MLSVKFSKAQLRSIEKAISKLGDSKTANQIVSKAARVSAKLHLLPQSKAATPVSKAPVKRGVKSKPKPPPGRLRKSTKIRTIKRKQNSAGVSVGYADKDFTGDVFYGGFIEYGFRVGDRKLGNSRTQVKGQGNLRKVAQANGAKAAEYAAKLIADAMEKVAKR